MKNNNERNNERINNLLRKCINHEFEVLDTFEDLNRNVILAYAEMTDSQVLDVFEEYFGTTIYYLESVGIAWLTFKREIDGKIIKVKDSILEEYTFFNDNKYLLSDLEGYIIK